MEDLVVLDYSTQEVHFYKVSSDEIDVDEFLKERGLASSQCSWMFAESLTIKTHNNG